MAAVAASDLAVLDIKMPRIAGWAVATAPAGTHAGGLLTSKEMR